MNCKYCRCRSLSLSLCYLVSAAPVFHWYCDAISLAHQRREICGRYNVLLRTSRGSAIFLEVLRRSHSTNVSNINISPKGAEKMVLTVKMRATLNEDIWLACNSHLVKVFFSPRTELKCHWFQEVSIESFSFDSFLHGSMWKYRKDLRNYYKYDTMSFFIC